MSVRESTTRYLGLDEAKLVLWAAIQDAKNIGHPTDDKLIVDALWEMGVRLAVYDELRYPHRTLETYQPTHEFVSEFNAS